MGTTTRSIIAAIGAASVLTLGIGAASWDGDGSAVRTTRRSTVLGSADALERRALGTTVAPPTCDPEDFLGSVDAYERHARGCVEPAEVFYGSPDSVERQGGR